MYSAICIELELEIHYLQLGIKAQACLSGY